MVYQKILATLSLILVSPSSLFARLQVTFNLQKILWPLKMFEILIWHCVELSHQELIKDPFWVKSLAESGVLSQNVYSGLWLLSSVHWAEAVKSTHSMLTDNFQKFCDCFYARIYPPSPITRNGNEGRKALGKMQTLPCLHWQKYYDLKSENFNWWLMKQCNLIPKFI